MTQDKVKLVCQGAAPWKTSIFWKDELSSLLEGEWAGTGFQRGLTQEFHSGEQEALLSPKEGWSREWEEWLDGTQRK